MLINRYTKLIIIGCALLLTAIVARPRLQAQLAPQPAPAVQHTILLDVVVTDRAGNPIPGLKQEDFTVLDDKHPQAITSFREAVGMGPQADPPLQAVVLVDGINNSHHHLQMLKEQLAEFLRQNSELPIPLSLDFITSKSQTQTEPTRDGKAVLASLNSAKFGLEQFYDEPQLYAFREDLAELVRNEAKIPGRKLLVSLGPGWRAYEAANESPSNGSDLSVFQNVAWMPGGSDPYEGAKRNKVVFDDIIWMSAMLRQGRVTFYSVDLMETMGNVDSFRQFTRGSTSPQNVFAAQMDVAEVLAVLTGGLVRNRSNNVAESMSRCLQDARVYYTLTFQPEPGSPPGKYHDLQVKVDKPELVGRTRTGYYSGPDREEDGLAPFHNFSSR
jgi:VWFA-related protein